MKMALGTLKEEILIIVYVKSGRFWIRVDEVTARTPQTMSIGCNVPN